MGHRLALGEWCLSQRSLCASRVGAAALAAFAPHALLMQSRWRDRQHALPDPAFGARPVDVATLARHANDRVRVQLLAARCRCSRASAGLFASCKHGRARAASWRRPMQPRQQRTVCTVDSGDALAVRASPWPRATPVAARQLLVACCWCSHALGWSPALARRVVRTHRHAKRMALVVALASPWDRVRVHVRCALPLQRRTCEGSSAALADPAARSQRADAVASGAVRQRTTRLVLGRHLRMLRSDKEEVSEGESKIKIKQKILIASVLSRSSRTGTSSALALATAKKGGSDGDGAGGSSGA